MANNRDELEKSDHVPGGDRAVSLDIEGDNTDSHIDNGRDEGEGDRSRHGNSGSLVVVGMIKNGAILESEEESRSHEEKS